MKNSRFSKKEWELIDAYAHGYAYGCAKLVLDNLWHKDEEGYKYEEQGWIDGIAFVESCGELKGEAYKDLYWDEE